MDFYGKNPNKPNSFYYEEFPNLHQVRIRLIISKLVEADLNNELNIHKQNFWMFIISNENWDIVKTSNIIGSNNRNRVNSIREGDKIVVYVKLPLSSIMGVFEVITTFEENKKIFLGDIFPYRIKMKPLKILNKPIKFITIVDELEFIRNKKHWQSHLFGARGVYRLSKKDYDIIYNLVVN